MKLSKDPFDYYAWSEPDDYGRIVVRPKGDIHYDQELASSGPEFLRFGNGWLEECETMFVPDGDGFVSDEQLIASVPSNLRLFAAAGFTVLDVAQVRALLGEDENSDEDFEDEDHDFEDDDYIDYDEEDPEEDAN